LVSASSLGSVVPVTITTGIAWVLPLAAIFSNNWSPPPAGSCRSSKMTAGTSRWASMKPCIASYTASTWYPAARRVAERIATSVLSSSMTSTFAFGAMALVGRLTRPVVHLLRRQPERFHRAGEMVRGLGQLIGRRRDLLFARRRNLLGRRQQLVGPLRQAVQPRRDLLHQHAQLVR